MVKRIKLRKLLRGLREHKINRLKTFLNNITIILGMDLKEFVSKEIEPFAAENDRKGEFPVDIVKKLGAAGYLGMCISKEDGGMGLSTKEQCAVVEEIAKADASVACIVAAHASIGTFAIRHNGTGEQKKLLPRLAAGDIVACFSITEAGAGSDVASLQTTAEEIEDSFVLNGHKIFATNGKYADLITVAAKVEDEIKIFLVEKKIPGLRIGKSADKLGLRATDNCELFFENARVSKSNLVEGGFKTIMQALDESRVLIAGQAIGIAQRAYELSVEHCNNREQFGMKLVDIDAVKEKLEIMRRGIEESRKILDTAIERKQIGRYTKEAAQAKIFATEMASKVSNLAIQLHGGKGILKDYPIERLMRDARVTEIYEGANDVLRMIIDKSNK
jgi:butyryl-CoA dehydrogenase